MEKVETKLPDWIERQAEIGPNVDVDAKPSWENTFWYLLASCCPQIFESYAIILHPFWINWKIKNLMDSGEPISENSIFPFLYPKFDVVKLIEYALHAETDKIDNSELRSEFKRVSWKNFFTLFSKEFHLESAARTQEDIRIAININSWPPYLGFPAEGKCENEELIFIRDQLQCLFGDQTITYYYNSLKTKDWYNDSFFNGKLSELEQLFAMEELVESPTIYPNKKEWCVVTDHDLDFTFVGGTKEFISAITQNPDFDIYELQPRFKEKISA